ncbi:MAG: DUF3179 domain-containing protein [Gemmatimonadetes bacterium]|nr:DUF3179 domain-containing protein [Gemmatimonadota bacterium]MBT5144325.1 DUF3179 domain-containing protein [Gemmatimonadota bacterium]MBT5590010.1 DUF3179 domain-containing protein [Gemmatimonadota bacterium]MBT5960426.1 DUF3179 domain-containing protein [Gemmatimonadota bacterium]
MDTRTRWLQVLVLAGLGLTACGDDGDDAPVSPTGPGTGSGDIAPTEVSDVSAPASPADPETDPELPALPGAFGVPIGTQPGFVGAPFTASDFPTKEMLPITPRDAIPAITDPPMSTSPPPFLLEDDLVFGVVINGEARAYPHNIGWRHEIVNDVVGGHPVCVTFCPLTGTGLVFDGERADGSRLSLGVSGLLYNTNLVMYDRGDLQTLYPQIYASGVNGEVGQTLDLLPVVETTWSTWKRLYPQTLVQSDGPFNVSAYQNYPYGDYRTRNFFFLFPIRPTLAANGNPYSISYGAKVRVLGLRIDSQTLAFPFSEMGERAAINETVGGFDVLVAYDADSHLAIPYSRQVDGRTLTFDLADAEDLFPFGLRDRETGTLWDVKGQGINGELAGQSLRQIPAHSSMWFAWVTFWPDTDVWAPN